MRTLRTLALFALPVLFLSIAYFGTTSSQAQSPRHPDEMEWDVPATWVEFTANVTMTDGRTVRGTGRIYQNQDGSRREEWQLGDRRRIEIENAALNLYFTASDRKQSWTVQPWVGGVEGRRPGRTDPTQEKLEGYALTKAEAPNLTLYFAPQLAPDYAVRQVGADGSVTELSNIKVGPVPDQLFTPPPGAMTQFFQQSGGKSFFVRGTPAEMREAAKLPPDARKAYWQKVYAARTPVVVEADK